MEQTQSTIRTVVISIATVLATAILAAALIYVYADHDLKATRPGIGYPFTQGNRCPYTLCPYCHPESGPFRPDQRLGDMGSLPKSK